MSEDHHFESMPRRIRIGVYDVNVIIAPVDRDDKEIWGAYEDIQHRITLAAEIPTKLRAVNTLVHEINHAVFKAQCLREGDDEERICDGMANGWTQILRDNPTLLVWLCNMCQ
jgi:hypothetical protein